MMEEEEEGKVEEEDGSPPPPPPPPVYVTGGGGTMGGSEEPAPDAMLGMDPTLRSCGRSGMPGPGAGAASDGLPGAGRGGSGGAADGGGAPQDGRAGPDACRAPMESPPAAAVEARGEPRQLGGARGSEAPLVSGLARPEGGAEAAV